VVILSITITFNDLVKTTLIQSNTTQVYFYLADFPYIHATCFRRYLGHPQACQYRNHMKDDTIKI